MPNHRRLYISICRQLSLVSLTALALAGCSTAPATVRQGDRLAIAFDCRQADGSLAVSTRPDNEIGGESRSPLYLPRTTDERIELTAGGPQAIAPSNLGRTFEQEVVDRLSAAVVGMHEGEEGDLILSAQPASTGERPTRLARVRKRAKEMRLSREEYVNRTGAAPETGQQFVLDPLVPGTVTAVTGNEVVIAFAPKQSDGIETPFGPAKIRDAGDRYEIVIDASPGRLIRTGGLAGRIESVDDGFITLDYRHPFGGETLACHVKVGKVTGRNKKEPEPLTQMEQAVPVVSSADQALTDSFHEFMAGQAGAAVAGDLAAIDYTVSLADGAVVFTTRRDVAEDPARPRGAGYLPPAVFAPEQVAVGKRGLVPGVGEAVAGMKVGEKRQLTLAPEQGFGPVDPEKQSQLPLQRKLPRRLKIPAAEYLERFGAFPSVGREVPLTPWFPARVIEVGEREVAVELQVQDGASFSEPFGVMTVRVAGDEIITTLQPVMGGTFPLPQGEGRVVSSDGTTFTVDLNHPLAGKTVTVDLELAGLTRAEDLPGGDTPWQEDHDAALAAAKQEGRPALLVLYADWCSYCKRLFDETLPDPRIRSVQDRFAWIRVNSDQLTDFKKRYGQEGYPMIVLFRGDGSLARKLDGFQDAAMLRMALQEVL